MGKKKSSGTLWIILWIIIALIVLAAFVGLIFFLANRVPSTGSTITDTTIIERLINPANAPGVSCSLQLTPSIITEGDLVTGRISDGSNTFCEVFVKDHGDSWESGTSKIWEGTTDPFGNLEATEVVWVVGQTDFIAVCGDCVTNEALLTVESSTSLTCEDTDGKDKMTAGHATFDDRDFYDTCLDDSSLNEYYCVDGDSMGAELLYCDAGYTCFETRSGGYCMLIAPDDYEVGDNVGSGTSGSGSGSSGDDDSINVITMDWTTGGDYVLGAKITRSWNYVGDGCMGPEQYPMEWSLFDSNGMAWQQYDYVPVNSVIDYVCPVTYHEDAPWKFVIYIGIKDCPVEYSWNVQPYICEMNN